jgi:hypothetical protein
MEKEQEETHGREHMTSDWLYILTRNEGREKCGAGGSEIMAIVLLLFDLDRCQAQS